MHASLNHGEDRVPARGLTMATWEKNMPILLKACPGEFSQETQALLQDNRSGVQWASQRCEACGRTVGAEEAGERWIPERHWPSVAYPPRKVPLRPTRV